MLRRNILIFHAAALGDFVLTWPLGLALGRLYPQRRIIYVTRSQRGALVEKVLGLESLDIESGWHHLHGNPSQLPQACRSKLESAATIFTTFAPASDDPWMRSAQAIAADAAIIPIDSRPKAGRSDHVTQRLLDALVHQPAIHSAVQQILASIATCGVARRRQTPTGDILIHPGSGSPLKTWPAPSFLQLIQLLKDDGHSVKVLLGEVERERWSPELRERFAAAATVIEPRTDVDLFEHLNQAAAFVGNDSGPGHLAGIIGVPTLSLFGPSDPAVWRPLGPRVATLRYMPLPELAPTDVHARLRELLASRR